MSKEMKKKLMELRGRGNASWAAKHEDGSSRVTTYACYASLYRNKQVTMLYVDGLCAYYYYTNVQQHVSDPKTKDLIRQLFLLPIVRKAFLGRPSFPSMERAPLVVNTTLPATVIFTSLFILRRPQEVNHTHAYTFFLKRGLRKKTAALLAMLVSSRKLADGSYANYPANSQHGFIDANAICIDRYMRLMTGREEFSLGGHVECRVGTHKPRVSEFFLSKNRTTKLPTKQENTGGWFSDTVVDMDALVVYGKKWEKENT